MSAGGPGRSSDIGEDFADVKDFRDVKGFRDLKDFRAGSRTGC